VGTAAASAGTAANKLRPFIQGLHAFCSSYPPDLATTKWLALRKRERVRYNNGSCDADNWEQFGGSNFHLTLFVGAEDSRNIRLLVFEAQEKLVQGSLHFSGKGLGEKEKAAWTEGWMNLVQPYQKPDEVFSTPLDCEMMNKNHVLHKHYRANVPSSLDEKKSRKSAGRKCQPSVRSLKFKELFGASSLRSCMSCAR